MKDYEEMKNAKVYKTKTPGYFWIRTHPEGKEVLVKEVYSQ